MARVIFLKGTDENNDVQAFQEAHVTLHGLRGNAQVLGDGAAGKGGPLSGSLRQTIF